MKRRLLILAFATLVPFGGAAFAGDFNLDVLVDGVARPEYRARGTVYVEALRGEEYALRLENPNPWRVAVALSVDGLNTIDASHTDARVASKWVIDPYDSIVISGWQVSNRAARRFFFTGERNSYGAALGQTENLGVIAAVVFRERPRPVRRYFERGEPRPMPEGASRDSAEESRGAPAPSASAKSQPALSDDYAATGMGDRTRHHVERVVMDLDPDPIATISIRYEFRPQLVKLGVLPAHPTPLERRESARGFEPWCPEPK